MSQYDAQKLILNITDALANSVPKRNYNDVLTALKRCQEMIGKLSSIVVDLDHDQRHGEIMLEAKLYANVLGGFFDDMNLDFFDLRKGYDPRQYLKDKGVILSAGVTMSKEDYVARLRDQLGSVPPKRRRGRPAGSKNKPKPAPVKGKKGARK